MTSPLLYTISDAGTVETHSSFSGMFPLQGYLYKLKQKPSMLGGTWTKRYFVVEERRDKSSIEWYFSYYQSETHTKNVKDAGDAVALHEITFISLLSMSGRHALYTSPASALDERLKKELTTYKDLIFEVETPQRVYFLRADSRHTLLRWASGLQRMSGFAVNVPWLTEFGPQLPIPETVLKERMAHNDLPPDIDKVVRPILLRVPTAAAPALLATHPSSSSMSARHEPVKMAVPTPVTAAAPIRSVGGTAPQSPASRQFSSGSETSGAPSVRPQSATSEPGKEVLPSSSSTIAATAPPKTTLAASSARTTPQPLKAKEDIIIDSEDEASEKVAASVKVVSEKRLPVLPPPEAIVLQAPTPSNVVGQTSSSKPTTDARTKQGLLEAAIASAARRASASSAVSDGDKERAASTTAVEKQSTVKQGVKQPAVEAKSTPLQGAAMRKSIADDFDDEEEDDRTAVTAPKPAIKSAPARQEDSKLQESPVPLPKNRPPLPPSNPPPTHAVAAVRVSLAANRTQQPGMSAPGVNSKANHVVGSDRDWDDWDDSPKKPVVSAESKVEPAPTQQKQLVAPASRAPAHAAAAAAVSLVRGTLHAKGSASNAVPVPAPAKASVVKPADAGVAVDKDFLSANWDD